MFWESVGAGFKMYAHWQTYAAGLIYVVLSLGPPLLLGSLATRSEQASGVVGCFLLVVRPFFQVFSLFIFVLTLSPIIFGTGDGAAWSLPWILAAAAPWAITKFIGLLLLGAFALNFIPIIGSLDSLHILFLGSLALILVIVLMGSYKVDFDTTRMVLWPGFWFVIGLLVVGSVMAWIGAIVAASAVVFVEAKFEGTGQLIFLPVAAVFGFIPVFIYGAWLGSQIHAALGT